MSKDKVSSLDQVTADSVFRTTVTIDGALAVHVPELMKRRAVSKFSNYVEHLIRKDFEAGSAPSAPASVPPNVVAGQFIQPKRRTGSITLPELGSIAAGDEDQMEELMQQADFHIEVPAWYADLKAAFVLRVKGDSMNAAVPEPIFTGQRVIMALRSPVEGEIIAALIDGKTTLKRFMMEQGKAVLISESTNPIHRNIIPLEGLEWKGVMVGRVEN